MVVLLSEGKGIVDLHRSLGSFVQAHASFRRRKEAESRELQLMSRFTGTVARSERSFGFGDLVA